MGNQLLLLTITAFVVLFYYKNQIPNNYFNIALVALAILFIISIRRNLIYENFDDDSSAINRPVRYGDVITLWGWTNAFMRFNAGNGLIDVSARLTQPEDIPRVGWIWEFLFLEDPKEISVGINNNSNPLKYGDKIIIRSTYKVGYVAINPSGNDQSVITSTNRDEWTQLQLISTETSAKGGQAVKYGDQLYLKTNKGTYLTVSDDGLIKHTSIQDNKALFTITDRYGQGGLLNWARRGTATQSSIYGNFLPNNAIDGNILTFNHTQNDDNSWWLVTLPRDIYIDKITIANRHDCCQDRLTDFDVMILDQNSNIIQTKYYESAGTGITWPNINQIARIVKVQLRKKNYLHMAEVGVFGTAVNYSILLEKPLSSDLLNEPRTFSSAKAIDDPTNTLTIANVDLPYNNQTKAVSVATFIKLLKTNPDETTILHKGSSDTDRSPAITVPGNTSRLRFYYNTTQTNSQFFDSPDEYPINQWIHITYIIDGGIGTNTGWQLGSFSSKLAQAPYEQCCYYINPLLKQYYYLPANLSASTAKSNIWDPSVLNGLKYMGQLTAQMLKPQAFVYINGIPKTPVQLSAMPKLNNGPLNVGKSPSLSLKSGDFVIDQLKYFNYHVTDSEITQLTRLPLLGITKTLLFKVPDARNMTNFEPNALPLIETDFTINFWLSTSRPPNGTGRADQIFFKGSQQNDRAPAMWFLSDSNALTTIIKTRNKAYATGEGILKSNFIFPVNEWHHVGLTLADKTLTLYIDGKTTNQFTLSDNPVYTTSPFQVGGFTGQLYNFQVSNFPMTQEQILIAMGPNPDEQYNVMIRQMWKDVGCLTNPIPDRTPNAHADWKNLIKSDQKSRVEGVIADIKKKADKGDKKMQEMCYGKFTAGMLDKLAEKDKLIQYTLDKQKDGTQCLPIAPFDCPQKTINDFDIRTHKDFNKYTLSSRIQKCTITPSQADITNDPTFVKMKQELDDSKSMITKLETLRTQLEQERAGLAKTVNDASDKAQLTPDQLMQYPAFKDLFDKYNAQQANLQQVNQVIESQKNMIADLESKANSQDCTQNPEVQKMLQECESNRKLTQNNLAQNLDLSQLQNNPLFMQTLEDLKRNAMAPQCTTDQIMNSPEYLALQNGNGGVNEQIMNASKLSQNAVVELEKTKKLLAEILKNLSNLNLDNNTMNRLMSGDINNPDFQNLLKKIKTNGSNNGNGNGNSNLNGKCTPGMFRIEDHPEYNRYADDMRKVACNNTNVKTTKN